MPYDFDPRQRPLNHGQPSNSAFCGGAVLRMSSVTPDAKTRGGRGSRPEVDDSLRSVNEKHDSPDSNSARDQS
jgi:hypothetical protein